MPASSLAAARPNIILSETDADRITDLALGARQRAPEVSRLLLEEVERAEVCRDDQAPADIVGMGARVEFIDETHAESRLVTLVYPAQADIAAGRISILSPVGAGLLGLRPGQSIQWPDRDGRERALRVVSVRRADGPVNPA